MSRAQSRNPIGTSKHSGTALMAIADAAYLKTRKLLTCVRSVQEMREERGLCSIHIQKYFNPGSTSSFGPGNYNAKIMADVQWATGISTYQALVDVTRGAQFTIGACDHVSIDVYWDKVRFDLDFLETIAWRVDATATWMGSTSPKAAYYTDYAEQMNELDDSTLISIPRMAKDMMVLVSNDAILPDLVAKFYSPGAVGAGAMLLYEVHNSFANGVPVVSGASAVQFSNEGSESSLIIPTWELWL